MTLSVGQIAQIIDSGNFTQAISFGALPSAAARILALGNSFTTTSGTATASDNQSGNTYVSDLNSVVGGSTLFAVDCASIGTPSGTFTATVSGLGGYDFGMLEIDGSTSIASSCTATATGTSSTSFAASVTAAAATTGPAIAIAMMWMQSFGGSGYGVGWNTPSGWTNASILNTGLGRIGRIDYIVLSGATTPSANWGSSINDAGASQPWNAAILVYNGSGGGGTIYTPYTQTQFFVNDRVVQF